MANYLLTHTGAQVDEAVSLALAGVQDGSITFAKLNSSVFATPSDVIDGTSSTTLITPAALSESGIITSGAVNVIRNPKFTVNQRTVSGTVTLSAGAFGHDGWKAGSGGCTYTFSSTQGRTTLNITAGSLVQTVDGTDLPAGVNTMCLSWGGTCQGKIGAGSYAASGVTGEATGGTNISVEFGIGTLYEPQLVRGTVAGEFDCLDYSLEIQRCQYYYNKLTSLSYLTYQAAATGFRQTISFPRMRGIPTPVTSNISYFNSSTAAISGVTASSLQFGATAGNAGAAAVTMDVELTGLEI